MKNKEKVESIIELSKTLVKLKKVKFVLDNSTTFNTVGINLLYESENYNDLNPANKHEGDVLSSFLETINSKIIEIENLIDGNFEVTSNAS